MKNFVLHTFDWKSKKTPTLKSLATKFKLNVSDFDPNFNVVLIDPHTNTYCVMIDELKLKNLHDNSEFRGPFSNPKIEPFDLQE
jgi:hypothetical protein